MSPDEGATSVRATWSRVRRVGAVLLAVAGGLLLLAGALLTLWTVMLAVTGWYPSAEVQQRLTPAELASYSTDFRNRCYIATVVGGVVMILGSGLCLRARGLIVAAIVVIPIIAAAVFAFGRVTVGQ
jgi:hypothetical protein